MSNAPHRHRANDIGPVSSLRHPRGAAVVSGLLIVLVLLADIATAAGARMSSLWTPNNAVYASVLDGTTLYVGGDFTYVGPYTGAAAAVDTSSGLAAGDFPAVNGAINTVIPDGSGGWYIGGTFTRVGGVAQALLAHINPDKTLDVAFQPVITGITPAVHALALQGDTLFIGGRFTAINGQGRFNVAAMDTVSRTLSAWNPNANNTVFALAVAGSNVYLGGQFSSVGGTARTNIASVDSGTAALLAWNPAANSTVRALHLSGSTLYAGGQFTLIGGQARNRMAALDAAGGTATAWNPNVSGTVFAIAQQGATVYIGGQFTLVNAATARNSIAALDSGTALATAWNPNAGNSIVRALLVSGTNLYVGGSFTSIGGQTRLRIAALDTGTGLATAWHPSAGDTVNSLALSATTLLVGGDFNTVGGVPRNRLAAIDTLTGQATGWDPDVNGSVYALAVAGDKLYAGGAFTLVAGVTRNRLAAIDTTTASVDASWDPAPNSTVWALLADAAQVFVGGQFTSLGGQSRNYLARLDPANGANPGTTDPVWNANIIGSVVYNIATADSRLFIAGNFTALSGQSRNNLAALNRATAALDMAWNPNANAEAYYIAPRDQHVYLAGTFTSLGGMVRNRLGRVDVSTAALDNTWSPSIGTAGSWINAIRFIDDNVYVAGKFTTVGAATQPYVAGFDRVSGDLLAWNPGAEKEIWTLATSGRDIYMGADRLPLGGNDWLLTGVRFSPPVSQANAAGGAYNSAQTVSLTCIDSAGGACGKTYYSLDGSTPTRASSVYASPLAITANTTLSYFSTDLAGIDEAPKADTYVIDATSPVTVAAPAAGTYADTQSVSLTCSDDNSGCVFTHYTLDGTPPSLASPVYSGPIAIASNTTLRYFSRDNAGNAEAAQSQTYVIDTVPPITQSNIAAGSYTSLLNVSLSCSDDNSGCAVTYYTLDGSAVTALSNLYTDPFTLYMNTVVRFFSRDQVGNSETAQSISYLINTPPRASGATFSIAEDTSLTGVLPANDDQGDALTFSLAAAPALGQVSITHPASGTFSYRPDPDRYGDDSFSFKVNDGTFDSNIAVVNIHISAENDAPRLLTHGVRGLITRPGQPVGFNLGVQDIDSGDQHSFTASFVSSGTASTALGTVALSGNQLTFTPQAQGSDQLRLSVSDAGGLTDQVIIPVRVYGNRGQDTLAIALGLDPQAPGGDSDGDGLADGFEIGDPLSPTDTDGDGIIDALEIGDAADDPRVLDFRVSDITARQLKLPALRGERLILTADHPLIAHNNANWGVPVYAESQLAVEDAAYWFPYGLLDFSVATSESTATVRIQLPGSHAPSRGAVVRKRGELVWYTPDNASFDPATHTITLHLRDNDDMDVDPAPGVIRDPVNVGEPDRPFGGGGCTINPQARFEPLAPLPYLLLWLGLLAVRQTRSSPDAYLAMMGMPSIGHNAEMANTITTSRARLAGMPALKNSQDVN